MLLNGETRMYARDAALLLPWSRENTIVARVDLCFVAGAAEIRKCWLSLGSTRRKFEFAMDVLKVCDSKY